MPSPSPTSVADLIRKPQYHPFLVILYFIPSIILCDDWVVCVGLSIIPVSRANSFNWDCKLVVPVWENSRTICFWIKYHIIVMFGNIFMKWPPRQPWMQSFFARKAESQIEWKWSPCFPKPIHPWIRTGTDTWFIGWYMHTVSDRYFLYSYVWHRFLLCLSLVGGAF